MIDLKKHLSALSLAAGLLLIGFTLWAEDFASEFQTLEHSVIGENAPYIMNMIAAETLIFMLFYHRLALSIGLAAGFLWFPAGDAMAIPYWVATMAFWVYLFDALCNHKPRDKNSQDNACAQMLFWLMSMASYCIAYSGIPHYWYLTGFILIFIVTLPLYISSSPTPQEGTESSLQEAPAEHAPVGQHPQEHNDAVYVEEGEYAFSAVEPPFEEEIVRLESLTFLPEHINKNVQGIIKYARLIQDCILTDTRNVEPGTKFLQRYLPPTLDIIEKGYDLTQRLKKHDSAYELPHDKVQILEALHSAFLQQYTQLLENDATHLKTEISTLEKLLKTDGFL